MKAEDLIALMRLQILLSNIFDVPYAPLEVKNNLNETGKLLKILSENYLMPLEQYAYTPQISIPIDFLKAVSNVAKSMIHYKLGSVKDTYSSSSWKDLEYMVDAIRNDVFEAYQQDILGRVFEEVIFFLPLFIHKIAASECQAMTLFGINKDEFREIKKEEYKGFGNNKIFFLKDMCAFSRNTLTLKKLEYYLEFASALNIEKDLDARLAILRIFTIIGESMKGLSKEDGSRIFFVSSGMRSLFTLRDWLVHHLDAQCIGANVFIGAFLEGKREEIELVSQVIQHDFPILMHHVRTALRLQMERAHPKTNIWGAVQILDKIRSRHIVQGFKYTEKLIQGFSEAKQRKTSTATTDTSFGEGMLIKTAEEYSSYLPKIKVSEQDTAQLAQEFLLINLGQLAKYLERSSWVSDYGTNKLLRTLQYLGEVRDRLMHDEAAFDRHQIQQFCADISSTQQNSWFILLKVASIRSQYFKAIPKIMSFLEEYKNRYKKAIAALRTEIKQMQVWAKNRSNQPKHLEELCHKWPEPNVPSRIKDLSVGEMQLQIALRGKYLQPARLHYIKQMAALSDDKVPEHIERKLNKTLLEAQYRDFYLKVGFFLNRWDFSRKEYKASFKTQLMYYGEVRERAKATVLGPTVSENREKTARA